MISDSPARQYVHYACTPATFHPDTRYLVRWLDWERDFALAATIWPVESPLAREAWHEARELGYRYCGLVRHTCGKPRLLAVAAVWHYSQTAWEVAAVRTQPDARRRGYAKSVVSFITAHILEAGRRATCTTEDDNLAMQKTAESVGFVRIDD